MVDEFDGRPSIPHLILEFDMQSSERSRVWPTHRPKDSHQVGLLLETPQAHLLRLSSARQVFEIAVGLKNQGRMDAFGLSSEPFA